MNAKSFGAGRLFWTIRGAALFGAALASAYLGCASATRAFEEGKGGEGGEGGEGGSGAGSTDSASGGGGMGSGGMGGGGGTACGAGLTLCGAACLDLMTDEASCGACDKPCGAGEECLAGMCGPACSPGSAFCDGVCVDTASDPMNCGGCGIPCPAGEVCAAGTCSQCSGGAVLKSAAPAGSMVLCDHPADSVCEQDAETLCPSGWGLCSYLQHKARSAGWGFALGANIVIGEIYCRTGGGAGHFTLPDSSGQPATLEDPAPFNCYYGSSVPACPSMFGCNEQNAMALCCAPTPTCGNGVVDSAEEDCDDGNLLENDECLSSCAWRLPAQHGYSGTNCQ